MFIKKHFDKILFIFTFFFIAFVLEKQSFAGQNDMCCNVSSQCRMGFVCVGGVAEKADESNTGGTGCCEPIMPLRQVCLIHNIIAGAFGAGVTALVVISMGISVVFQGKIEMNKLLTFFVGVICIFGSYQVVKLLTGWDHQVCELVDAINNVPGVCACSGSESLDKILDRSTKIPTQITDIQW